MRSQPPYLSSLSISPYGKSIPYAGNALIREDGNANYGFKNLKIKPELIETIPELVSDNALKSLVRSLNVNTNFFSTGCFSHAIGEKPVECQSVGQSVGQSGDQQYKYRGYIEFSLNCRASVQDARNYFSLFFHFESFLRDHHFSQPVKLDWKIEEAYFSNIAIKGFTCAIFVRTFSYSSREAASRCWQRSLQVLESFFVSVPNQASIAIYQNSRTTQEPHFGYLRI